MKQVWYYNGFDRNLNFWDFVDMTEDYRMEKAINEYKKYREVAFVNEHIIYNMVAAHIYSCWDKGLRKYDKKQVMTAINYLGGVNSIGLKRNTEFITRKVLPLLNKHLHKKHYLKLVDWLKQGDKL